MKALVVAHPDDEILWFNPLEFDRIVICFSDVPGKPHMIKRRERALEEHPLRYKIHCMNLMESEDSTEKSSLEKVACRLKWLSEQEKWQTVTTHAATGEYGHRDHKLVFTACMVGLDIPVNGVNPSMYREIRECYYRNACWTWDT